MKQPDKRYYFGEAGQRLAISEWGQGDKPVIVFVHGFPGCADQCGLLMTTPYFEHFRLIAFDRPGYGNSDFQRGLTPIKLARQVEKLVDQLGVRELKVLSVSGGAPFAWAIAHQLGHRVLKLSSVAGVAPLTISNFKYMNRAQRRAWILRNFVPSPILKFGMNRIWDSGLDRVEEFLFSNIEEFSVPDQIVFKNSEVAPHLIGTVKAALRPGPSGVLQDMKTYSRPWGFQVDKVNCPITLWHGDKDDVVNFRYSLELESKVPSARLNLISGEGHYSLPLNFRDKIIEDLLQM